MTMLTAIKAITRKVQRSTESAGVSLCNECEAREDIGADDSRLKVNESR